MAGLLLAGPVFVVAGVAWQLAEKPVSGTEGLILQEQMLIAVVQSLLAYAVAMSALTSVRLVQRSTAEGKEERRRALCSALVGSAIECATHAASLGHLRKFNRKWHRRGLPDTKAQAGFAVTGWTLMSSAAAQVSKNVEEVRYEAPELLSLALELFDEVSSAMDQASGGNVEGLYLTAERIRRKADEIHSLIDAQEKAS